MLIASGNPKELVVMFSTFILNNEIVKVIQEIDDFPLVLLLIVRWL